MASFFKNTGLPENSRLWEHIPGQIPTSGEELWNFFDSQKGRSTYIIYAITGDPRRFNHAPSGAADADRATPPEDRETVGLIGYLDIQRENRSVEVGFVIFTPLLQQTLAGTEAHYLVLKNVCEPRKPEQGLPYRRITWKCNALNVKSRRAAQRLGYTYEGTLRNHMVVRGRSRDSNYLSLLDDEWPLVKAGFEAWMKPENFDTDGRQIKALDRIRQELSSQPKADAA